MYKITMTVHHGREYTATAEGTYPHEAFTRLMGKGLGAGYGPTGNYKRAVVLTELSRSGAAQHGWADYRMEEVAV